MTDSAGRTPPGTRIDWTEVYARLERARQSLESHWESSPEVARRILTARAELLSRERRLSESDSESLEVVEFLLGKERYAIESAYVREIVSLKDLTPLPCTPSFIAGIIQVQGRIVSVIHLKELFDLPQEGLTNLNRVIILQRDRMEFGLLVDAAVLHTRISIREIQPPLPTFTGLRAKFSRGVTKDSLVVLNASQILDDETLTHPASDQR